MRATHLCGVTKNLRIGCSFNVVPMWHQLRLAEDCAMADILTGGRVIFGVHIYRRLQEEIGRKTMRIEASKSSAARGRFTLVRAPGRVTASSPTSGSSAPIRVRSFAPVGCPVLAAKGWRAWGGMNSPALHGWLT
jgi:hypothetical protein